MDNTTEGALTPILMKLQQSITEVGGRLERLEEHINAALAMSPRLEALEKKIATMETIQGENEKRMNRLWSAFTGGSVLSVVALVVFWMLDHFKLK